MNLSIVIVATFLSPCVVSDVETVRAKALEATRAACDAIPRARGQGRFEHRVTEIVDGQVRTALNVHGAFTFAYSGSRDFVKFTPSPDGEFEAAVCVVDGNAVLSSRFSPRIRPDGAEGDIATPSGELGNPEKFGITPHAILNAATYFDPSNQRFKHVPARLTEENGFHVLQFDEKGLTTKFFIDPAKEFHVVGLRRLTPDGRTHTIIEKGWAKTDDGLWYVRRYSKERFPLVGVGVSWTFEFDSFDPNVSIPDELFGVDALALPVGASIVDRRLVPPEVIRVRPPTTDVALLESVVGELPRVGVASAPPPSKGSRSRWALVLTSIGILVLILGGLLFHRFHARSRSNRPNPEPR